MRIPGLACALLSLACGDIVTVAGDGPPADAGPPDARATGTVTVTMGRIFGSGQPLAGHQVVLVSPDGEVAADLTTDEGGVASADDIEAGSTLILLVAEPPAGAPPGSQAIVVLGVEPGDDIRLRGEAEDGPDLGEMNVSWPARTGAGNYEVATGCSTGITTGTSSALGYREGCVADGQAAVLVRATDGIDATLGWIGGAATFTAGGNFTVGGNWTDPSPIAVTLSDIPAEAQRVLPRLQPARGGVHFQRMAVPAIELEAAEVSVDLPAPAAFADSNLVTLEFVANQTALGGQLLAARLPVGETALPLALGDQLLPWYGHPLFDQDARRFSWSRGDGLEPDAQYLLMFWTEKGSTSQRATFILVPPDVTSVTVPELPDGFEPFLPVNAESIGVQLQAAEASDLDGWDAARQLGLDPIFPDGPLGAEPPSMIRRAFAGEDF